MFNKINFPINTKIIVGFSSSGCMGEINNFEFLGYVTKEYKSECGVDMYKVQPIFSGSVDSRSGVLEEKTAWQIQHIKDNFYAFYY